MAEANPEVKSITSPDLEEGSLPENPCNCLVLIEAEIGVRGEKGADIFSFTVVTPSALGEANSRWGRGLLIVPRFTWQGVQAALDKLLAHCHGETWDEVSANLNKELHWEFENYQS